MSTDAPASREDQFALTVDLGTTGLKVGLVSFTGEIAWTDHHVLETHRPEADAYEQDAAEWWTVIIGMLRTGLASGVIRPEQVRAVSVTGQWASTVPVDEHGNPVGPCIVWTDRRGRHYAKQALGGPAAGYAPAQLVRWLRRTGGAPPLDKGPLAAHLHLVRDRPDIASAARWFLEPVDYLTMRFCGTAAATQASMTAHFLVDLRTLDHIAFDSDLVRRTGIDAAKLAPLQATGTVVGTVTQEVAAALGIGDDVPVTSGLPDIHTAPAGSGAVLPGEGHLVVSTTSWISCSIDRKKSNLLQEIISIPGPVQGTYTVFDNIDTAGACLDWFRRVVSLDGTSPHEVDAGDLVDLAGGVPPGANGVVFAPWLSGAQAPFADGHARAGFHNVTLASGAAELARAVLEGVAVQNALLLESVEKFAGTRLDPLRIIGGGARSDLWCQIHADALDRTIERVEQPLNAGLRGAALNAAMTLGAVKPDEVRDLVPVDTTFRPDPATRPVYARLADGLRKVHKGQKRALKVLNQRR